MSENSKAYGSKTPEQSLGQRKAFTVSLDGVALPSRIPCRLKAYAGFGDWLQADTDRRWSGTVVPDERETETICQIVAESLCKKYIRKESRLLCSKINPGVSGSKTNIVNSRLSKATSSIARPPAGAPPFMGGTYPRFRCLRPTVVYNRTAGTNSEGKGNQVDD